MMDRIEAWYDKIGKKILYTLAILVGIYLFFRYVLELVLPFVIAWGLSYLLNPFVTFLNRRARIHRGFGTLLAIGTILGGLVSAITVLVRQLWSQVKALSQNFDVYRAEVEYYINLLDTQWQEVVNQLPFAGAFGAFGSLEGILTGILAYISGFLDDIVKGTTSVVSGVPNALFFTIVTLLATFFITKDHDEIKRIMSEMLPKKIVKQFKVVRNGLKGALGGYIRTQLILMCFTFIICLVGLGVLRRNYVLLIAVGIAVLDALPVFGSGAILIPWAIYYMLIGNFVVGAGLLAVYGIIVVMRQVMEPKVLSTQIGIHPLLTLMAMYIGFKTIGFIGMIIGPIVVVVAKTIKSMGVREQL